MERILKRVLDYKLVFDCLADSSNGMVSLHVLSARWPREEEETGGKKNSRACAVVRRGEAATDPVSHFQI